jgi:hypothetical protein
LHWRIVGNQTSLGMQAKRKIHTGTTAGNWTRVVQPVPNSLSYTGSYVRYEVQKSGSISLVNLEANS